MTTRNSFAQRQSSAPAPQWLLPSLYRNDHQRNFLSQLVPRFPQLVGAHRSTRRLALRHARRVAFVGARDVAAAAPLVMREGAGDQAEAALVVHRLRLETVRLLAGLHDLAAVHAAGSHELLLHSRTS